MDILTLVKIKNDLEHSLKRITDLKRLLDDELDQVHLETAEIIELLKLELPDKKNIS